MSALLIKGFSLEKNMKTGDWDVSVVDTNKGKFQLSDEVQIKSERTARFVDAVRAQVQPFIEEFLKEEELEQERLRKQARSKTEVQEENS